MYIKDKKRMIKSLAGGTAYVAMAYVSKRVIKKLVTQQPQKDIAIQVSSAFWSIAYILYNYYAVEKQN